MVVPMARFLLRLNWIPRCFTALLLCILIPIAVLADTGLYLGSKAPYQVLQDSSTYEPSPAGFSQIYVETVARHGSRGLSSPSADLVLYNLWLDAQAKGALTKAGRLLGPDLLRIIRANALLGYGVAGITSPGYGNLTLLGIAEHTGLARRLASRMSALFAGAGAQTAPRQVIVSTSGVNRAIDSSKFFLQSLEASVPGIAALVMNSPPLTAYPLDNPAARAAGVNRFQLYFHKLTAKTDLPATTDPYYPTYQYSLQYQNFLANDPTMNGKVNGILYSAASYAAAHKVMTSLFSQPFINQLDAGITRYNNAATFTFTSSDGKFKTSITGDGQTFINNSVDAVNSLYAVYSITPAMINEVPVNMGKYFPPGTLRTFGYLSDVRDFYQKGPSITEELPITFAMSQSLLDDFFNEGSAIAAGNLAHAAKLRFTHAEIMIPFQEKLGLRGASLPVPAAGSYTWQNNPWRGEVNASLTQNVQWDFYTNGSTLLVKMYYNEAETDFPAVCEFARYRPGSHYYTFRGLKTCYGY
jgi:hypothetical protein